MLLCGAGAAMDDGDHMSCTSRTGGMEPTGRASMSPVPGWAGGGVPTAPGGGVGARVPPTRLPPWAVAPAMDATSSATTKEAFMVSGVWVGCLRAIGGKSVVSTGQLDSPESGVSRGLKQGGPGWTARQPAACGCVACDRRKKSAALTRASWAGDRMTRFPTAAVCPTTVDRRCGMIHARQRRARSAAEACHHQG